MINQPGFLRSTSLVTLLSLVSLGAAFLLQVFLASRFGAAAETDAFRVANVLPTLLNAVFLTSLNITFIPVFIGYEARADQDEAWRVAGSFLVLVAALLLLLCLAGGLGAASLVGLIAPGLRATPETLQLAARLLRLLLPSTLFMALGGLLGSIFYSRGQFVLPTLGPLVSNGTALGGAWLLAPRLGVAAVAWGVLLGSLIQFGFLLWPLRRRLPQMMRIDVRHPGVTQIVGLMLPWIAGALIYKANPLVDSYIGSRFGEGTIAILGYALTVVQLAVIVTSKGASVVTFPALARTIATGRLSGLPAIIDAGLRLVVTAVVPVFVFLLIGGEDIIRALFERGEFGPAASAQTYRALLAYLGAFVAQALGNVVSYVYYSLQDTRTPALVGSVGMGINVALALLLQSRVGFWAPALSFSVMAVFNVTVLLLLLRRRLGKVTSPGFGRYTAGLLLAGAGMLFALLAGTRLLDAGLDALLRVMLLGSSGIAVYTLLWAGLNPRLVRHALIRLRRRPLEL